MLLLGSSQRLHSFSLQWLILHLNRLRNFHPSSRYCLSVSRSSSISFSLGTNSQQVASPNADSTFSRPPMPGEICTNSVSSGGKAPPNSCYSSTDLRVRFPSHHRLSTSRSCAVSSTNTATKRNYSAMVKAKNGSHTQRPNPSFNSDPAGTGCVLKQYPWVLRSR